MVNYRTIHVFCASLLVVNSCKVAEPFCGRRLLAECCDASCFV